jgi:type VI secretion system secreted protein Hcp
MPKEQSYVDYFLKLDGITGESKDAKHRDEIDILSWSVGTTRRDYSAGDDTASAHIKDIMATKYVDKASTQLFASYTTARRIKTLVITCRKGGKDQQEYLVFTCTDALVSSWEAEGSNGDKPEVETVTFSFRKIAINYWEQQDNGTLGGVMNAEYDLTRKQPAN